METWSVPSEKHIWRRSLPRIPALRDTRASCTSREGLFARVACSPLRGRRRFAPPLSRRTLRVLLGSNPVCLASITRHKKSSHSPRHCEGSVNFFCSGGERGIRTLEGLLTLTPLAGERFRPLSHLSVRHVLWHESVL